MGERSDLTLVAPERGDLALQSRFHVDEQVGPEDRRQLLEGPLGRRGNLEGQHVGVGMSGDHQHLHHTLLASIDRRSTFPESRTSRLSSPQLASRSTTLMWDSNGPYCCG